MEREPNSLQDEQNQGTEYNTLQNMPKFEEHMENPGEEKTYRDKNAEIEENVAEMTADDATIFIAGRTNGISRIDAFGVERGGKVQSETGEIEDRKMSEQYALWRVAKDIASSYSEEAPRHIRFKALRDFSVVQRAWDGKSLDAQKKDCDNKLITLDEQMAAAAKEQPNEPIEILEWLGNYVRLVQDYDNNLLRRDSIDKVTGDLAPYIQEYEQYEQGLNKSENEF